MRRSADLYSRKKTCMITDLSKRDAKGLEDKLNSRFELAVESSDVPEDEEAPVLLSNGTFAASAEGRDRVLWFTGEGGDG